MELSDISKKYVNVLNDFFRNDRVIDLIYEEQYGADFYNNNKSACKAEYNNILNHTIFIPYVTLDHLEKYLNAVNPETDIRDYSLEKELLTELRAKREQIIKHSYPALFDEIVKLCPKLNTADFKSALYNEKSEIISDVEKIEANINELLDNNKREIFPLKRKRITQLVSKYTQDTLDQILMETSTYHFHTLSVPDGTAAPDFLAFIKSSSQLVHEDCSNKSIGNRYKYIFLPVLTFSNKTFDGKTHNECLEMALHEVMHISKEKEKNGIIQSGLIETLGAKPRLLRNFIQNLAWIKAKTSFLIHKKDFVADSVYNDYDHTKDDKAFEEILNQWETLKVMKKITSDIDLKYKFQTPYSKARRYYINGKALDASKVLEAQLLGSTADITLDNPVCTYNYTHAVVKNFMEKFDADIKNVNNGTMSASEFRKLVGKSNFASLGHLFNIWTSANSKAIAFNRPDVNYEKCHKVSLTYNLFGNSIVNDMLRTTNKSAGRTAVVEKTLALGADQIMNVTDVIQKQIENKDCTSMPQSHNTSKPNHDLSSR